MALKSFKPITPGLRQLVIVDRSGLYKGKPEKSLTEGLSSKGGRNNTGRITVRFRGGGHKRTYRVVDFKRRARLGDIATVQRIEYDPNRTAYIALIAYDDGEKAYILAPQRLAAGDKVTAAEQADIKPGNAMPIGNIPVGTVVHNIETKIGRGGSIARSAGSYAQIVGRDRGYVSVRLGSGEQRLVHGPVQGLVRGLGQDPGRCHTDSVVIAAPGDVTGPEGTGRYARSRRNGARHRRRCAPASGPDRCRAIHVRHPRRCRTRPPRGCRRS